MHHPQTVGFELEIRFDRFERPDDKPRAIRLIFHEFDNMIQRYHQERKRRSLADRATSGRYKMFLTDHGKAVCAADEYRRRSHIDAIEGTWFDM